MGALVEIGEGEFFVYRFYDQRGLLLYVGSTRRLPTRLRQHADSKSWWSEVARMSIERYATRDEMIAAEQSGIDEGSQHNLARAHGKTPISGFRIPEDVKAAAVERAEAEGKTLTDVVVEHLRRYGKKKR